MARADLVLRVVELVGNRATVLNLGDGWPSRVRIELPGGRQEFDFHLARIGSMARRAHEVRFQNPGQYRPIKLVPGVIPLLLGFFEDENGPVVVNADAIERVERSTRFSILFDKSILREAQLNGWAAPYVNTRLEAREAMHPSFLPAFLQMTRAGVAVPAEKVQSVLEGAGWGEDTPETVAERSRRATTSLIRDAAFAKNVIGAYSGRCAMCNLDLGLVVGAHIFPASAPGSHDEVWNGLALCPNHHTAFDAHRIFVEARTYKVRVHPEMAESAAEDDFSKPFLKSLLPELVLPTRADLHPRAEMFQRRYDYFGSQYNWAV